jgi:hypothetical protein
MDLVFITPDVQSLRNRNSGDSHKLLQENE